MSPIDVIASLFDQEGQREYFGEAVSVSTHMLQAAALAELAGSPDALVAAALLHDIGHLRTLGSAAGDPRHEEVGAAWLAQWLPASVTEPVRLHVAAKRYLCAAEPGYLERLSPASVQSLAVQGGPMSGDEVRAFRQQRFIEDAVAVRRWDDAAKDPAAPTPQFEHFRPLLARFLSSFATD
jgi:gamma-butyrobetaine dioxygenase